MLLFVMICSWIIRRAYRFLRGPAVPAGADFAPIVPKSSDFCKGIVPLRICGRRFSGGIGSEAPRQRIALWRRLWYAVVGAADKRRAVRSPVRTGAVLMVPYSGLIQLGILIVGIIALFFQVNEKKK